MGGGPDQAPEHLYITLPFPEPKPIVERIKKEHPYIKITYYDTTTNKDFSMMHESIPVGTRDCKPFTTDNHRLTVTQKPGRTQPSSSPSPPYLPNRKTVRTSVHLPSPYDLNFTNTNSLQSSSTSSRPVRTTSPRIPFTPTARFLSQRPPASTAPPSPNGS